MIILNLIDGSTREIDWISIPKWGFSGSSKVAGPAITELINERKSEIILTSKFGDWNTVIERIPAISILSFLIKD